MSDLSLFRLVPVNLDSNPRWREATCHGEVLVRAASPADARVVAAEAEIDFLDLPAKPSHGASTRFASVFLDDHLYAVEEVDGDEAPREGPRAVVVGNLRRDVIKPASTPEP